MDDSTKIPDTFSRIIIICFYKKELIENVWLMMIKQQATNTELNIEMGSLFPALHSSSLQVQCVTYTS